MAFCSGKNLVLVAFSLSWIGNTDAESLEMRLVRSAEAAHQAFSASSNYLSAWSKQLDPATGLLPQRLGENVWTPENSAADNFPFMVIASRFLRSKGEAESLFGRAMVGEKLHTIQEANLPSEYDLDSRRRKVRSPERLIFGASEYAKDGLVPMLEILGPGLWYSRMRELVEGIFQLAPVATSYGALPSNDAEVNGEMLQILCRLYFMTGKQTYLDWSRRIGDAYFYEVLPLNYGVPAHFWNFETSQSSGDKLRLRDHGCEIISGLSLLYTVELERNSGRSRSYYPAMRRMLDRVAEIGAHESGLHYNSVVAATGEIADDKFSDNWGYNYDAYLAFFMATGEEKYRDYVLRVLQSLHRFRGYDWEPGETSQADGYADSIEGALGLLNHLPVESAFDWVESEVQLLLSFQQKSGIVEGWWGDGNFCRTALMFAFFHSRGTYCLPWRDDLRLSAEETENGLRVLMSAGAYWKGTLHFDPPRHRYPLGMTKDYPRINAFPEWFTVEALQLYEVTGLKADPLVVLGQELIDGLEVELSGNRPAFLHVQQLNAGSP
jgi:hypothetical protein